MKLGFIGCGNMAHAMIGGILSQGILAKEEIIGADIFPASRDKMEKDYGITMTESNEEVVEKADIVVLSIKPQYTEEVIKGISNYVHGGQIFVTIIPGKTLAWLEKIFGAKIKIIRTMPNTPAMVREGMTAVCPNKYVHDDELQEVMHIFEGFGKVEVVRENLLDTVVAVSGSAPAYVFVFIESLADAAVKGGMSREQAYHFVAQAVYGSAKMVLETGKHPGQLKDMVCSPAGTTIEAIRTLDEKGFRSAIFEAALNCAEAAKNL